MMRIAVLVSGNGSNLQALIDACADGRIAGKIVGVLSNRAQAYALTRAQTHHIENAVILHQDFPTREAFDAAVLQQLQLWQADLVVLAGFMRIITPTLIHAYAGRMINIHPSLLPHYRGLHTHARVLASGERQHGCSVHFVTPELDAGACIAQGILAVHPNDDLSRLQNRVHQLEHLIYPRVVSWFAKNRLVLKENQIYLDLEPLTQPIQFWHNT